jgi:mono/diheme cytochrome c family protein
MSSRSITRLTGTVLMIFFFGVLYGCTTPKGDAKNGQRWFAMNNCSACHGPHGNDGKAPNIAHIDMSFTSFIKRLRTTDAPIMPYYPESKISQQDAADIYAYLQSIDK